MKTMKVFLMAMLVTMTAFLTACNSEDSVTEANANGERGVVKTEFTISFPQTTTGLTRLGADVVQVAAESNLTKFRGIKDIVLYPFLSAPADISKTTEVPTGITLYGGTVGQAGASGTDNNTITGSSALYSGSNSHLYKNVDIAVGTKSFIFYGEAATTSTQNAKEVGSLTKKVAGTTFEKITFEPTPIFTGTLVGSNGEAVAAYLTSVANTEDADGNKWSETTNPGLKTLYENFTSITTGAWANVKAAMQRVYKNLKESASESDLAANAAMKTAICNAITNNTYVASVSGTALTFNEDFENYPADLGLPDGAAYVTWDATNKKFTTLVTAEHNTGMDVAPLSAFVYPASLYYWVKSGIKTSEEAKDSHSNDDTWATITSGYNKGTEVTSKTRSIVITDPVQYAVARLDLTLKATSPLLDASNQTITLYSGDSYKFPVTGIIVGGQKAVDWKFEQITKGTAYTMYDSQVADGGTRYLSTTATSAIHTLLLETNDATSATDEAANIQIAVELENNSDQTIVGYNKQYILPGCKFYLIGTLKPWKDGETIKRAFKQDYTTTANLTINSLANAHSTLPDLGIPQMNLGVSIDLTWQTGVTHDITIQ